MNKTELTAKIAESAGLSKVDAKKALDATLAAIVEAVKAGDKVTQLVVMPVVYPTYRECDKIQGGERGDGGFGSTGR